MPGRTAHDWDAYLLRARSTGDAAHVTPRDDDGSLHASCAAPKYRGGRHEHAQMCTRFRKRMPAHRRSDDGNRLPNAANNIFPGRRVHGSVDTNLSAPCKCNHACSLSNAHNVINAIPPSLSNSSVYTESVRTNTHRRNIPCVRCMRYFRPFPGGGRSGGLYGAVPRECYTTPLPPPRQNDFFQSANF